MNQLELSEIIDKVVNKSDLTTRYSIIRSIYGSDYDFV